MCTQLTTMAVSSKEKHLRYSVCYICVLLFSTSMVFTQDEERLPQATNLEIIQMLGRQVGDSVVSVLNSGDSVRVMVRPSQTAWFVRGVIMQAVEGGGCIPTESLSSPVEMDIGLMSANVEYTNIRRTGLFGGKIIDRLVRVSFAANVVDKRTGMVLLNGNLTRSSSDVIEVSEVSRIENPGIPETRGVLPEEGFFSFLLEPLVVVGAIAVAVYLLFHVRS
ncbi:MAG TPA: hypothetical protein DGH68_03955 [Bacteroidetes bacterium]|nr:hypothetical protein [Bacteroidota bacterium]